VREAGASGFQVVIDYVWGQPTEAFLSAITIRTFVAIATEIRLVQVGEGAGPTISLPAALLRSTALIILGTAGIPTRDVLTDALQRVMAYAAKWRASGGYHGYSPSGCRTRMAAEAIGSPHSYHSLDSANRT